MLVTGGTLIDVDGERVADVRTGPDGRIAEVAPGLTPLPGRGGRRRRGQLRHPRRHRRPHPPAPPARGHRGQRRLRHGHVAAAIGGTTTVIEYVTAERGSDPVERLEDWRRRAEPASVDVGMHMTFTEAVSEGVVAECIERGVTTFKLYMAYPETLQVDDDVILDILTMAKRRGGMVTIHAENGGAITALRRQALAAGRTGVFEHSRTRPALLEGEAVARATALAEVAEAPIYVVHMSSAPALQALRAAQERGVAAYGETCPQYLFLDADRLADPDGENFVCTPPLRDPWHSEELWEGLARGWLHTVATDHCPFWVADRHAGMQGRPEGWQDFTEIPGGLPGIETRLALIWDGVQRGKLSRSDWVRLCAEAPARLFGLWPQKGSPAGGRRRRPGGVGPAPHPEPRRRRAAHGHRPLALRGHDRHRLAVARHRAGEGRGTRRPLRRRARLRPLRRAGPDHPRLSHARGGASARARPTISASRRSRARRA